VWTAAGQPAAALLPPPDEPVDFAGVVVFAGEDSFDDDSLGDDSLGEDSFDEDSFDEDPADEDSFDDDEPSEGAFSVPPERLSVR
jgi:hypothetical protein